MNHQSYGKSCSRYLLGAFVALSLLLANASYAVTSGEGNGIARVQSTSTEGTNVSQVTQSFNSTTTAGNLILAFVRMTTTVQTVTVADTLGNTFQPAVSQKQTFSGYQIALYYAVNAKTGPDTVTASFSNTNAHPWLALYEYSGVNALDTVAHNQGVGSILSTGAAPQTSLATELVFTGFGFPAATSAAFVPGSGFTLDQQQPAQGWSRAATEVATVAVAGSYAGAASLNGKSAWAGVMATFKHKTSSPAPVAVSVTPNAVSVQVKSTKQFMASVTSSNNAVTWAVNGVPGGNATYGTINTNGLYNARPLYPAAAMRW